MKRVLWLAFILILVFLLVIGYNFYTSKLTNIQIYSTIANVITVIFGINVCLIILTVILENRDPRASIAWLQLLTLLPVQGFVLYLIFGINWRKRKIFNKKAILDENQFKKLSLYNNPYNLNNNLQNSYPETKIINLLQNSNYSNLTQFNKIACFHSGKKAINNLFLEIEKAKHHIHIMFFKIANDSIGYKLRELLIQKAMCGVKVKVIYDDVGSYDMKKKYKSALIKAGVEIYPFYPVNIRYFANRVNYRNHRKLVVIDGKVGFTGGVNIGDKYANKSKYFGFWRDTLIKIYGDTVYELQKIFIQDWIFASKNSFETKNLFPTHNITNKLNMQIITSGPDAKWENIMQYYFMAISSAKKYIWITTPYLVLDESLTMALKTAALAKVDVKIIVPQKPDHKIVFLGTRSYFESLLEAGVKIYEYKKGFVHSKIMLFDDKISSIGSANLDIRSFKLNFEVNTIIYDKNFGKDLKNQLVQDLKNSKQVILSEWKRRKRITKFLESLARLLSPIL